MRQMLRYRDLNFFLIAGISNAGITEMICFFNLFYIKTFKVGPEAKVKFYSIQNSLFYTCHLTHQMFAQQQMVPNGLPVRVV